MAMRGVGVRSAGSAPSTHYGSEPLYRTPYRVRRTRCRRLPSEPLFLDAPEPHHLVGAAGQDQAAVGGDGDGLHAVLVGFDLPHLAEASHVPDAHRPVVTAGDGEPAVGAEGRA